MVPYRYLCCLAAAGARGDNAAWRLRGIGRTGNDREWGCVAGAGASDIAFLKNGNDSHWGILDPNNKFAASNIVVQQNVTYFLVGRIT
jgi:hypothetical protein